MKYNVVINDTVIYTGGRLTAYNRFKHAVLEDWKDEQDIQLVREDGYVEEEHLSEN